MNVGLLIITHGETGATLLRTAVDILGVCPLPAQTMAVHNDEDPESLLHKARALAQQLDQGAGLLILTDLFGSTPSNVACELQSFHRARVIAGINLSMLIRVLNYPDLHLEELSHKAISGGKDGILVCKRAKKD